MRLIDRLRRRLFVHGCGRAVRALRSADPEALAAEGGRRLLKVFHRAARTVPAYGRILASRPVRPDAIRTLDEFRESVPVQDKNSVFGEHPLDDLCVGGELSQARSFHSSSGSSGMFSFGLETPAEMRRAAQGVDFLLQNHFAALTRKTLLFNCLPMGQRIPTQWLPVANTSLREDVVGALIGKLTDQFEQFILIGEHLFLKRVVEAGQEESGIRWSKLVVHLVTGAEYIAEGWRTYMAGLLGHDFARPDRGWIAINYGLSELASSLFAECAETVRIRRLAQADSAFRKALCGEDNGILPNVMQYFPHQIFVETVPDAQRRAELVISILGPHRKLPMIRYNTHDVARLMPYARLAELLNDFHRPDLLPPLRLPVVLTWGRLSPLTLAGGGAILPEQVKDALYGDNELPGRITGNFRLTDQPDGPHLAVQLRPGQSDGTVPESLVSRLTRTTGQTVATRLLAYHDFPHGMELNYERKNRYV